MGIHMIALYFEAGVSVQRAYLHASREVAAGRRHENAAVFEWTLKINKSTFDLPLFDISYHKPCRPRHIVIQVLPCCNYSLVLPWRWLRAENNIAAYVRRTLDPKQRNLSATLSRRDQRLYRTARAEPDVCELETTSTRTPFLLF
jgi:hypothetical protein